MTPIARSTRGLIAAFVLAALSLAPGLPAQNAVATPDQFFGFRIGSDNKLARWDKIVEYMRQVAGTSRSRPLPRARQDHERQSVHRAGDQPAPIR